jgi:hypothetical protein
MIGFGPRAKVTAGDTLRRLAACSPNRRPRRHGQYGSPKTGAGRPLPFEHVAVLFGGGGGEGGPRTPATWRRSAEGESALRGEQAIVRPPAGIEANPVYRSGILPELLREDFRRRITGVLASCAKAILHCLCQSREPQTRKRDGGCLGNRSEGLPFPGHQRYGIDDHRVSRR